MQQIKIFKTVENEIADLEERINAWIRESGARVISIAGNIAPQSEGARPGAASLGKSPFVASDVIIFVLYETPAS